MLKKADAAAVLVGDQRAARSNRQSSFGHNAVNAEVVRPRVSYDARSMRLNRTRSPTSKIKGARSSGVRMRVGERPMMDQPVGMVRVVTRHCGPAISTLPAGMSRTAADLRGT